MKIDPNKLFPAGLVKREPLDYISQLYMSREMVPDVLAALEELGVIWATGVGIQDFNPVEEESDDNYFFLEFFLRSPSLTSEAGTELRVCYGSCEEYPSPNPDAGQFWIDDVLMGEIARPEPLDLTALLTAEVLS